MTDYDKGRVEKMWPWYLSGGGGYEWYLKKPENHNYDQIIDDYRITKTMPKHIGIAVNELVKLPLLDMAPHNELLVDMPNAYASRSRASCMPSTTSGRGRVFGWTSAA